MGAVNHRALAVKRLERAFGKVIWIKGGPPKRRKGQNPHQRTLPLDGDDQP